MAEYNANEINDLSQVSNQLKQSSHTAKQAASGVKNTASSVGNSAKDRIKKTHDNLKKKKQAKKVKKKEEKARKKIRNAFRRIIGAIAGMAGGFFIFLLLAAVFVTFLLSSVASALSGAHIISEQNKAAMYSDGDASSFVEIAHEQLGNKGDKYWKAMGCSPDNWCAMYAGWLLREAGGVDLSEYGWNANVGGWCDAFKAKGLYHHTGGSYIPSIGDIMFKGTSQTFRTHVGVVIGVENGKITTSEGNATSGSYDVTTVTEKTYDINDSSIVGYGHVTLVFADGSYTPRLTQPEKSSKYYNSNENPFQAAGYGILPNGGNCTAYAWGRAYEILGVKPKLSTASARYWYGYNQQTKAYPYGKEPKVGAILCLSDNGNGAGGHVAVVEKVNSDGSIVTSESGWQSYVFKTNTRYKSDNYTLGGPYTFQGFIYIYSGTDTGTIKFQKVNGLSDDESKVYYYFTSKGLSKAATCGIMANIMAECSFSSYWYFAEYVPDALGAPGNSGGICMWYADNNARFRRDCPNWKTSIDAQTVYLYQTLVKNDNGGLGINDKYYYGASGIWSMLKSKPNTESGARSAAYDFCRRYENPSWGSETKRMNFASNYWNKVKNL